jgi:histidinol-phosphatase (PHP family)
MSWTNYHSHCRYCDGTDNPEHYVEQAVSDQVRAYGFSSHAPVPFDCNWSMKPEALSAYVSEIQQIKEKWQSDIQIYCGLEVDYIPGIFGPKSPILTNVGLDYTIGSIHFVDAFPDGRRWEIDGLHTFFLQGLKEIFKGDIGRAVSRYFELTRQMIEQECPNVVGHLDKIKMQSEEGSLFSESADWYREEIMQTLQVIADVGVTVEVNTRGLYKKKVDETYPSRWVLEQMLLMNIPVMLNSDAHHPNEITQCFSESAKQLLEVGYRELCVLLDGKWQSVGFNENGLLI